jgi:hypothetical protein
MDHMSIYGLLNLTFIPVKSYPRHIKLYKHACIEDLNTHFDQVPWDAIFQETHSINDLVDVVKTVLNDASERYIPSKCVTIRPSDKPGMTNKVRLLFRQQSRLHKKAQGSTNQIVINAYKEKRREANQQWKQAKQDYYLKLGNKLGNAQTSSKTYWSLVKSLFGPGSGQSIPPIIDNNITHIDASSKADIFNEYFASQCTIDQQPVGFRLPTIQYVTDARLESGHSRESGQSYIP